MYNMMSNCYIIYFIYIKFYLIVCVFVLGGGGNIRKQETKIGSKLLSSVLGRR